MALTPERVLDALRTVRDPDLGKDLVTLGMVKRHDVDGDRALVTVELTTPACPMKDRIREDIEQAVQKAAARRSSTATSQRAPSSGSFRSFRSTASSRRSP